LSFLFLFPVVRETTPTVKNINRNIIAWSNWENTHLILYQITNSNIVTTLKIVQIVEKIVDISIELCMTWDSWPKIAFINEQTFVEKLYVEYFVKNTSCVVFCKIKIFTVESSRKCWNDLLKFLLFWENDWNMKI
jgi:hypothetical protein